MGLNRVFWRSGLILFLILGSLVFEAGAQTVYYVGKKDTLWQIAQKFNVSVAEIQAANGLTDATIHRKQRLVIPSPAESESPPQEPEASWTYTVQAGDTLYLLAQRFNTTVAALRSLNNLPSDMLQIGQTLSIPSGSAPEQQQPAVYTVQPGDSLFTIAQSVGTTVAELRALNNIWTDTIYVGQRLLVPAGSSPVQKPPPGSEYSAAELDLMARLVTAESLGEPYEGMVAVAAVVLNRIADPAYPNTVHDVIYQVVDGRYYQFSPVLDGRINEPAAASAVQAVQDAIAGSDPSNAALGFYNPAKTSSTWVRAQPVTAVIGNHVFFGK